MTGQASLTELKLKKSVSQRFEKQRFEGSFQDDWTSHIEDFNDLCDSYQVTEDERVRLLKVTISGEARVFYNSHVRGRNISWRNCMHLFGDEFAHYAKKAVFSEELQSLSFQTFVQDKRPLDESLELLSSKIHQISALAEDQDNTDAARTRALKRAVTGESFCIMALSRLRPGYSFSELKKALYQSIVDMRDNQKATSNSTDILCSSCLKQSDIMYSSQGRLRSRNRHQHQHQHKNRNRHHHPKMTCFNCEKVGCSLVK